VVEFSKEDYQMQSSEAYNTRVYTFQWYVCQVSISNQAGLVLTIMLNIKYQMYSNFIIALGWICFETPVLKSLVLILGMPFYSVASLGVATLCIYPNCMGKVLEYLVAKLVLGCSLIGAQFGLISHMTQLLSHLAMPLNLFHPSGSRRLLSRA